jgi:gamma-glutamylcyclotransferase (GGCT)/AIG2-like uncharacterized protein YtfP
MTAETLMRNEPAHIFVYGSLMGGFELHHWLRDSEFVCGGAVAGKLVTLGAYPGLLDGDGLVRGEVYRCPSIDGWLTGIDRVERCDPTNPTHSLFVRVARRITLTDGAELDAWVYMLNQRQTSAPFIPGGDWRAFVATLTGTP